MILYHILQNIDFFFFFLIFEEIALTYTTEVDKLYIHVCKDLAAELLLHGKFRLTNCGVTDPSIFIAHKNCIFIAHKRLNIYCAQKAVHGFCLI